jgi:cellulose synthase/poly-beta-1,6-N-acetylglucosamine synthase-like glycosyltransferase
VFVVDNNSTDNTKEVARRHESGASIPIKYVFERVQGKSPALNAGIQAGLGELVAMIDDDEQVAVDWLECISKLFENHGLDFAGGPYRPEWGAEKPDWITKECGGIVGWVDGGEVEQSYGTSYNGTLNGGNAVIRRSVLEQIGPFNTSLGRTPKGLLTGEDAEMLGRLLASGFIGKYVPDLVIYHYVPPQRMTRRYHRLWSWGHGTSMGIIGRTTKSGVAELLGIPRWQIRHAAVGLARAVKGSLGLENAATTFQGELRIWNLAGYINGRFFAKI